MLTQGPATEMLERARPSVTLAQQLEKRLVLLKEKEKTTDNQHWRSWGLDHDQEQKGQPTWYT